jgi:hypothetical protein
MSALHDAALGFGRKGVPVFPVCGKLPLTDHGLKDASAEVGKIHQWWTTWPDANVAIPTGSPIKRFVLDVDPRDGGDASLAALEAKHGPLPATLVSHTGGGGRHFFFQQPDGLVVRNSAGKLGPGLDIRGDGGYVVVPPSIHPETKIAYAWGSNTKPVPAPDWLTKLIAATTSPATPEATVPESAIPSGQRNDTLARIAGAMRRKGCTQDAIEAALLAENAQRCNPPLTEGEVRAIAKSVSRYAPQEQPQPSSPAPGTPDQTGIVLRSFKDIAPKPLRWLWPGRIPLNKLVLFSGDPDQGKSLVTIDIASRLTHGAAFPDGAPCESGSVIFLSSEDDAEDTIRPRLDAAGADVSRVYQLQMVRVRLASGELVEKEFSLDTDLLALEKVLGENPDVRLIVIDPISAYLGETNAHNNSEVRSILTPFTAMAARCGVTVIAVNHLRKTPGPAVHRSIDSIAFVAAARSVWAFAADPENEDRHFMVVMKGNLGKKGHGLAYSITGPIGAPYLEWEPGTVALNADEVLGGPEGNEARSELRDAMDWLRDFLSAGSVPSGQIKAAAVKAGLSWRTVRRAKDALGIKPEKAGFDEGWLWQLPPEDGQESPKVSNLKAWTSSDNLATFGASEESEGPEADEEEERI